MVPLPIPAVPQFGVPPLESPRDTSVVLIFDPILSVSVVLSSEPSNGNANLKGWKNALVEKADTVDPNFVPVYSQSEEGTSFELPNVVLDRILLNMTSTLVGKFFSLCPKVEIVQKWVKDKWKLKGSVSVNAMPDTLFLLKLTIEEDVAHVLSGCWSYGRNNLSLYHWKVGFDPATDLQKIVSIWVRLLGLPLEY
ncbi:hypothetical protein SUGI_0458820 [Cryptomeria japonica]|nr:hypothetical protein SUGI_0458820 [Cryptomeria japonica]